MRSVGSYFHPPPSDEFTTVPLSGLQHIWKRVFEHVVDRGDSYKRAAFNNLHVKSRALDENTYADLRVSHDALSIERDVLIDAYHSPTTLSLDLVAKAHAYKNRAKLLYKDVLKTLESAKSISPPSKQNPLASFRFPSSDSIIPSTNHSQEPLIPAHKVVEALLPIEVHVVDVAAQPPSLLVERSTQLNLTGLDVANALQPDGCRPSVDNRGMYQYHMYTHEELHPDMDPFQSTEHAMELSDEASGKIRPLDVLQALDGLDGDIDVDAVVDLVRSVEGSKDDAFITRTVEAVRRKSGQEIADKLQYELDDKVRASSSSVTCQC